MTKLLLSFLILLAARLHAESYLYGSLATFTHDGYDNAKMLVLVPVIDGKAKWDKQETLCWWMTGPNNTEIPQSVKNKQESIKDLLKEYQFPVRKKGEKLPNLYEICRSLEEELKKAGDDGKIANLAVYIREVSFDKAPIREDLAIFLGEEPQSFSADLAKLGDLDGKRVEGAYLKGLEMDVLNSFTASFGSRMNDWLAREKQAEQDKRIQAQQDEIAKIKSVTEENANKKQPFIVLDLSLYLAAGGLLLVLCLLIWVFMLKNDLRENIDAQRNAARQFSNRAHQTTGNDRSHATSALQTDLNDLKRQQDDAKNSLEGINHKLDSIQEEIYRLENGPLAKQARLHKELGQEVTKQSEQVGEVQARFAVEFEKWQVKLLNLRNDVEELNRRVLDKAVEDEPTDSDNSLSERLARMEDLFESQASANQRLIEQIQDGQAKIINALAGGNAEKTQK